MSESGRGVARARALLWHARMTLPRQVIPGSFYMLTRRCTQRQFLLRPDDRTNQIFSYCVAEAAQRHGIHLLLPSAMSNHHHTVFFDPLGNAIEFTERFHKLCAKAQNAHRGRDENLWSCQAPSLVRLEPDEVIDELVYAATNPVKDGLVDRVDHWPGFNGFSLLVNARVQRIRRPPVHFRDNGTMPAEVTLELKIPAELGDPDEIRRQLRARVAAVEAAYAEERTRTGRRVVGCRKVKKQSWRSTSVTAEVPREFHPRFTARDPAAKAEAIAGHRQFQAAYRVARRLWFAGEPVTFPPGTYWLRRFANVPIAGA